MRIITFGGIAAIHGAETTDNFCIGGKTALRTPRPPQGKDDRRSLSDPAMRKSGRSGRADGVTFPAVAPAPVGSTPASSLRDVQIAARHADRVVAEILKVACHRDVGHAGLRPGQGCADSHPDPFEHSHVDAGDATSSSMVEVTRTGSVAVVTESPLDFECG
ncbi:hypothetical protein P3102_10260 [Amycolatopsis sp. QT-25]|uniref:hypothetical protein n=1 Tax=Amycolatopsis sp. QT-25 TaxID=3034022 RepID=UPI0023EA923E|nr:hypothetical protein [Amycolatopsis sp. QT-25]WET81563.1 hypothetical protein P3102_10260 [Amycolatopsis sp. QT-25]